MASIVGLEFNVWEGVKNPKRRLRRSTPYYGVRQRSCRFGFSNKLAYRKQVRFGGAVPFRAGLWQAARTGLRKSRTNVWRTLAYALV